MTTIALLGTGLLGHAIGQRLLEQGQTLKVWNRTPARISALIRAGATPIERLSEISTGCDAVITVLKDGPVTSDTRAAAASQQSVIAAIADAHDRGAIKSVLMRCRCTFTLSLHAC